MQIQITGCMFENIGRNNEHKNLKVIVLPCGFYKRRTNSIQHEKWSGSAGRSGQLYK